jgi:hypothetical protein
MNTFLSNRRSKRVIASVSVGLMLILAVSSQAQILDFFRDWSSSEITSILNNAGSARDKASSIKNKTGGVKAVVDTARSSLQALSGNTLDAVQDARESGSEQISAEIALSQAFVGDNNCAAYSPCDDFRNNMLLLLNDLTDIANSLTSLDATSAALGVQLDLSRAKKLIQSAPGAALYPIHRAMNDSGGQFLSGVLSMTSQVKENMVTAGAILDPTILPASQLNSMAAFSSQFAELPDTCSYVLTVPNVARATSFSILSAAITLKIVGKSLSALGETLVLGGPKEVGVHGYFKINFHDNKKKKYSVYVDGIADLLAKTSVAIDNKLIYCAALGNRVDLVQALQSTIFPANRRPD